MSLPVWNPLTKIWRKIILRSPPEPADRSTVGPPVSVFTYVSDPLDGSARDGKATLVGPPVTVIEVPPIE